MHKTLKLSLSFAVAILFSASTYAQTTTPPATAPAAKTPAAKTQTPATAATKKPAAPAAKTPLPLTTNKQKASYAIGINIGKSLHKDNVDVDTAAILRGLKDGLSSAKPALTDDEAKAALTALAAEVRKKAEEKSLVEGQANKKVGDAFLAANKTKESVVTLPSGLQYKILTAGTGPKPAATDTVSCNYRGTLLDGKEFDSSYKRGQPLSIQVNGVIKGWTEALQLMPVGSKWQLFIPSELGYGDRGGDPRSGIGPGATLIFEVELLSIQAKDKSE